MTGTLRIDEHRPLLLSPSLSLSQQQRACKASLRDFAITICDDDNDDEYTSMSSRSTTTTTTLRYTSLRSATASIAAVSPTCGYSQQQQHMVAQLSRKYVTQTIEDAVGQKRSRNKVAAASATSYGSIMLEPALDSSDSDSDNNANANNNSAKRIATTSLRALLCKLDEPRKRACDASDPLIPSSSGSNQSETESDSDGSCGSNTASSSSSSSSSSNGSLQSILRIRDSGLYACRKVKKHVSVEFRLDVADTVDSDYTKRQSSALSCVTSCMPRRLTIEEKAALYRVRPDLQLTPMPLLMRELDEIRRRRQRKLMFSILGGTLILLMIIVFYYMLAQTP